jgi:hypothetical protein
MEDRLDAIRQAMRKIIAEMDETVIGHYYRLGQEALKVDKLPTMSTYKKPLLEVLADDLDVHWRTLHDCRRLAREVPEAEFFRLAKPPVRWTHVRMLLVAGELASFAKWVKRIAKEELTCDDLARELRLSRPKKSAGVGRLPSPPKSFRAGLGQLQSASASFLKKMDHALFGAAFDFAHEVQFLARDDLTEEVRLAVAESIANLERIAELSQKHATRVRESLAAIECGGLRQKPKDETP